LPPTIIASRCSRSSALNFTMYFLTPAPVSPTNHIYPRHKGEPAQIQRSSEVSGTRATRFPMRAIGMVIVRLPFSRRSVRAAPARNG
jgi:hypothetical protein